MTTKLVPEASLTVLHALSSSTAFMFDRNLNALLCEHENGFNLTSQKLVLVIVY